jgi:hypothetical protein
VTKSHTFPAKKSENPYGKGFSNFVFPTFSVTLGQKAGNISDVVRQFIQTPSQSHFSSLLSSNSNLPQLHQQIGSIDTFINE